MVNDLEEVTLRRYPRVGQLKERLLQKGAVGALMAGSGSSIFGIFDGEESARKAFGRLRGDRGTQAYLVRSLH